MTKIQDLGEILSTGLILNPSNYALSQLSRELRNFFDLEDKDYSVITELKRSLNKKGLKKFVHLSSGFQEANVAIAMDSGNGVVSKIIPIEFSDNLPDITGSGHGRAPFLLPSILSETIKGNLPITSFKIKYYPFLSHANITEKDVAKYKSNIEPFGLEVMEKDDRPINFRKLRDKDSTVVGIDADMLKIVDKDKFYQSADAINKWMEHIEKIYPIYKSKVIPPQGEGFVFKQSVELNTDAGKYASYEPNKKNETSIEPESIKKGRHLNLFSWMGL